MGRFSMSKTMMAAVTFGMFILLITGLATARCGRPAPQATVIVTDSASFKTAKQRKADKPRTKKPRKAKPKPPRTAPSSRNYLDELATARDSI